MTSVFCVRVSCECGQAMAWTADLRWLAQEGLDVPGSPAFALGTQRLPVPGDARDVTGLFHVCCPRCFHLFRVLPLLRARFAAGKGMVLEAPGCQEGTRPQQSRPHP